MKNFENFEFQIIRLCQVLAFIKSLRISIRSAQQVQGCNWHKERFLIFSEDAVQLLS